MTHIDIEPPSKQQLLKTTGIAAAIAVGVLFIAVLPAEFGIDPLRTGHLLGLTSDDHASVDAHHVAAEPIQEYRVEMVLAPQSGWQEQDLKMWLDEGESMLYQWSATGDLTYDFHTDELGSYAGGAGVGTGTEGFLTAPVAGFHGFAVRNNGDEPVTLTLRFVGEFDPAFDLR